MKIATIGLDLAKTLFQVHGVDSQGHIVVRKQLRRADVPFFAKLEPCVVGMEACGSSHYWGRELTKLGHTVRLIAPQFVRPYVKNNKTDAADAEAICEAVRRPHMRFVPIKTQAQQTMFSLHQTARAKAIEALSNREFEHCEPLPTLIQMLVEHLRELGNKAAELKGHIRAMHRTDAPGQLLETIPGVGPLTASALAASIGDPRARCYSHGSHQAQMADSWVMKLCRRRHKNIAAVALAAKNARTAWALLVRKQVYQVSHVPIRPGVTVSQM